MCYVKSIMIVLLNLYFGFAHCTFIVKSIMYNNFKEIVYTIFIYLFSLNEGRFIKLFLK